MIDKPFLFRRPDLAQRLAAMLLGTDPLSQAGRSGLFMSAERRTGKTTFLRNDLLPALEAQGAAVLYVDLWSDRRRDPADLIAEAVQDGLARHTRAGTRIGGLLGRVRKASAKGKFAGVEAEVGFELDSVGRPGGTTLARALRALHEQVRRPIVFILDEAQHALATEGGTDALFALKAARDELNVTAERPQLAILATGSLRGKIANLVLRKNQAFYGADIHTFPTLGPDFVVQLAQRMLGHRLKPQDMPAAAKLYEAFRIVGFRPEEMAKVIQHAVVHEQPDLGEAIVQAALLQRAHLLGELRRQLAHLSPLQQAVLDRMARDGDDFSAFGKHSIAFYRAHAGDDRITASQVQKALDALVTEGLVWRSARGLYALDDQMLAEQGVSDTLPGITSGPAGGIWRG